MSTEKSSGLSTSTAILIGSCVISLGLYLGLSGRNQTPAPMPQVGESPTSAVPVAPAPVPVPVKPVVAAPIVDKKRVLEEATANLDKHKKALSEKCLAPSLAKKPEPSKVKYLFNITFDASGKVIARGVTEDRETARPDVLSCISASFPDLQVTPPGQSVLVDVPLELP
jgi:hypothetical protein